MFYFFHQHDGGFKALKIMVVGQDGYEEIIWELSDYRNTQYYLSFLFLTEYYYTIFKYLSMKKKI